MPRAGRALGVAAAVALSAAACGSTRQESLRHAQLRPLPPGAPHLARFDVSVEYVSPERLLRSARSVFLGTVVAKGGSEVVANASSATGPAITAHRIRFSVDRVFRGERVDSVDLTAVDAAELDPFHVGARYIVLAEPRTFGDEPTPRLAAVGYWQGAFEVGRGSSSDSVAINERGDSVRVSDPLSGVAVGRPQR